MSKVATDKPPSRSKEVAHYAASGRLFFVSMYRAGPMERIGIVKRGMPARDVETMAKRMAVSKDRLLATLGMARATVDRKARDNRPLSTDESARLLGMARLVGQVQQMVAESGTPEGFDAAEWVATWLETPLPALDGHKPATFMDTADGQGIVSTLVARMQTGAYS